VGKRAYWRAKAFAVMRPSAAPELAMRVGAVVRARASGEPLAAKVLQA
jgi:predicted metal-binding membrane protein